jgi:acetyl esterase/lipase
VFAINYRHAPAFRFPAQLHDVEAALDFVERNAAKYKVDPERLVLCGRSAGAPLALLAAYTNGTMRVRAVISYYGPTDLLSGYTNLPHPDHIGARSVLATYLGGTPTQLPAAYRAASPVNYVKPSLSATLLIQGGHDHIVKADFAVELYQKLMNTGNRAELLVVPWSEHAFDFVLRGLGNQLSLPYVTKFLQETTRKD